MARTTIELKYSDFKATKQKIDRILSANNYNSVSENGENIWKNGVGFLTAMKYIKIEYAENNVVVISGWIRAVAGAEQDLKGIVGALPKKQVMNVIKEIEMSIS